MQPNFTFSTQKDEEIDAEFESFLNGNDTLTSHIVIPLLTDSSLNQISPIKHQAPTKIPPLETGLSFSLVQSPSDFQSAPKQPENPAPIQRESIDTSNVPVNPDLFNSNNETVRVLSQVNRELQAELAKLKLELLNEKASQKEIQENLQKEENTPNKSQNSLKTGANLSKSPPRDSHETPLQKEQVGIQAQIREAQKYEFPSSHFFSTFLVS